MNDPTDDVIAMMKALQSNAQYEPPIVYMPDSTIIALGGDPNDWPELEGFPGVRVVTRQ